MTSFPRLDVLPLAQRQLWPELAAVTNAAFVLYGGTAIALYLGHRESVDFDFFTDRTFQPEELSAKFHFLREAEFLQTQRDTLTVLTSGDGNDSQRVKISFFGGLEFGRLKDPERTADGVLEVASLQDLLSHKLKVQRIEIRDYLDIDAILQNGLDLAQGCAGAQALFTVALGAGLSTRARGSGAHPARRHPDSRHRPPLRHERHYRERSSFRGATA
jgi:hypothetical protein